MLTARVTVGTSGSVVVLAGEADLTAASRFHAVLTAQLAGASRHLVIDVSGLRFADAASIRKLAIAARMLSGRGGGMTLLGPQPGVARLLILLGVDQLVTVLPTSCTPAAEGGRPAETHRETGPGHTRKTSDERAFE